MARHHVFSGSVYHSRSAGVLDGLSHAFDPPAPDQNVGHPVDPVRGIQHVSAGDYGVFAALQNYAPVSVSGRMAPGQHPAPILETLQASTSPRRRVSEEALASRRKMLSRRHVLGGVSPGRSPRPWAAIAVIIRIGTS